MSNPKPQIKRCAVYTRKSSEEGLEQEFNSLHAQRESCEAYIKSQAGEGWRVLPTNYDDGGISGGTMERPALKALLSDIEAGAVDIVVVYKVDRLTRSLSDFAKIIEIFDRRGASFVAVTQQFNTTSSMGRLTLNILLSFAQFEREVTGERIRDKFAASKRKGIWMGGLPPIGYDARDRKLVVNKAEAERVRYMFRRYNELNSVYLLKRDLDSKGVHSKARLTASGAPFGNVPISLGNLYVILRNPVYVGLTRHKDLRHPGLHEPIISQELWDETQARMDRNRQGTMARRSRRNPSPLTGKLFDEVGERLVPTHTSPRGRRYKFYISHFLVGRKVDAARRGWRLSAPKLEQTLAAVVETLLRDTTALASAWRTAGISFDRFPQFSMSVRDWIDRHLSRERLLEIIETVRLKEDGLRIELTLSRAIADAPILTIDVPMTVERRGVGMRLVMDAHHRPAEIDRALVAAVCRGHIWFDEIVTERISTTEIARREDVNPTYVSRMVRLAFLSPTIVKAIMAGRQPSSLNVDALMNSVELPWSWAEQEAVLGL